MTEAADRRSIDNLIGRDFPYCQGKYTTEPIADGFYLACGDLVSEPQLSAVLSLYAAQHPQADARASASMWSMYYFSGLVISPIILWALHGRTLSLAPKAMSACFDPQTGLLQHFVVADIGRTDEDGTIFDAMDEMIHAHAAPMIDILSCSGLSPKLLWSNLAVYIDWIAREIGDRISPDLGNIGLSLISAETWPDGRINPLCNLLRRHCEANCAELTRRRICCLRYILPGMPGCGMICPLPQGRN